MVTHTCSTSTQRLWYDVWVRDQAGLHSNIPQKRKATKTPLEMEKIQVDKPGAQGREVGTENSSGPRFLFLETGSSPPPLFWNYVVLAGLRPQLKLQTRNSKAKGGGRKGPGRGLTGQPTRPVDQKVNGGHQETAPWSKQIQTQQPNACHVTMRPERQQKTWAVWGLWGGKHLLGKHMQGAGEEMSEQGGCSRWLL